MVDQQPASVTGYARALGLFVLLAGVVVMHSVVFGLGHGGSGTTAHATHDTAPAHAASTAISAEPVAISHGAADDHQQVDSAPGAALAAPGCPAGDCGPAHSGLHGCVFVLTAMALALALALLYWVGPTRRDSTPVRSQWRRIRRARPPPWTVPTLADLAILRI